MNLIIIRYYPVPIYENGISYIIHTLYRLKKLKIKLIVFCFIEINLK